MNSQQFEPSVAQIPAFMKQQCQFCFWRKEMRNGKPTKVPYNPKLPACRAQTNHPETFGSYEEALAALRQTGGDGIGVRIDQGLWAIDIDHCVDENGQFSEMAAEIIRIMDSPTEYSPSGTGLHIYFTADSAIFSADRYYINNQKLGLEVYPTGKTYKFLTVTGKHLAGTPEEIASDRSTEVSVILERYMQRSLQTGTENSSDPEGTSSLTDDEVLTRASGSRNSEKFQRLWQGDISGYPSQSEADAALCAMLAFWCNRDAGQMDRLFRQSGLMRDKWNRSIGQSTYGADLIKRSCALCKTTYHPAANPEDAPPFIRFSAKGLPYVSCPLLANHIRETLHYRLVRDSGKHSLQIYVYDNGVYRLYAPDMFRGIIRDYIAGYGCQMYTKKSMKKYGQYSA